MVNADANELERTYTSNEWIGGHWPSFLAMFFSSVQLSRSLYLSSDCVPNTSNTWKSVQMIGFVFAHFVFDILACKFPVSSFFLFCSTSFYSTVDERLMCAHGAQHKVVLPQIPILSLLRFGPWTENMWKSELT